MKKFKVTNNGEPHICNEFQTHLNSREERMFFCPNCLFPIDNPKLLKARKIKVNYD